MKNLARKCAVMTRTWPRIGATDTPGILSNISFLANIGVGTKFPPNPSLKRPHRSEVPNLPQLAAGRVMVWGSMSCAAGRVYGVTSAVCAHEHQKS